MRFRQNRIDRLPRNRSTQSAAKLRANYDESSAFCRQVVKSSIAGTCATTQRNQARNQPKDNQQHRYWSPLLLSAIGRNAKKPHTNTQGRKDKAHARRRKARRQEGQTKRKKEQNTKEGKQYRTERNRTEKQQSDIKLKKWRNKKEENNRKERKQRKGKKEKHKTARRKEHISAGNRKK